VGYWWLYLFEDFGTGQHHIEQSGVLSKPGLWTTIKSPLPVPQYGYKVVVNWQRPGILWQAIID